jgi:hypothetical protein
MVLDRCQRPSELTRALDNFFAETISAPQKKTAVIYPIYTNSRTVYCPPVIDLSITTFSFLKFPLISSSQIISL